MVGGGCDGGETLPRPLAGAVRDSSARGAGFGFGGGVGDEDTDAPTLWLWLWLLLFALVVAVAVVDMADAARCEGGGGRRAGLAPE